MTSGWQALVQTFFPIAAHIAMTALSTSGANNKY